MAAPAPGAGHRHPATTKGTMFDFDDTAVRKRLLLLLLCGGMTACVTQRPVPAPMPAGLPAPGARQTGQLLLVNRPLADAVADFNRNNCKDGKPIILRDPALGRKTLVGRYPVNAPEMFARDVSALFRVPVNIGDDHIAIGVR